MTLANRVNPWGRIAATAERGTMTGNRGGKFHRDDRTLGQRRWAGRPCFFCRRAEAKRFLGARKVEAFDRQLHAERLGPRPLTELGDMPDGAIVDIDGQAFAVSGQQLLRWSFGGYTGKIPRRASMQARLLTPPSILRILANGYNPRWHESALQGGGT